MEFDEAAALLATTRGGFTLWVGAGASMALSGGKTPGWSELVNTLSGVAGSPVSSIGDMPDTLERLSAALGHSHFRRQLRERLLDPVVDDALDHWTLRDMAIFGCRASSVVSFNIEPISAWPFMAGKGGNVQMRTFRERAWNSLQINDASKPGIMNAPIYFPHGLLMFGNVVMTRSEYELHFLSKAVLVAIQIALGGDLVIVGMSLGDSYLRNAILAHRASLREIFIFGNTDAYPEWTRVARATFIRVEHAQLWQGLADAACEASPQLKQHRGLVEGYVSMKAEELQDQIRTFQREVVQAYKQGESDEARSRYRHFCEDAGFADGASDP